MLALYLVVGAIAVLIAFTSRLFENLPISEALLALAVGTALGPHGTGTLDVPGSSTQALLTDLTRVLLAFTLMTIAMRYPVDRLRANARPVVLLLLVVLPLMALLPTALAVVVLGLPLGLASVLGASLAPTDPVLASDVVSGHPARRALPGRPRQILSYESGMNDGLAVIFVVVALRLADVHDTRYVLLHGFGGVAAAVGLGLGLGLLAGWVRRRVRAAERVFQAESTFPLFTLTFSLFVLGVGDALNIDAILGVFVAGLAYNAMIDEDDREPQSRIEEGVDRVLLLPVFVIFGVALPWSDWLAMDWRLLLFVAGVMLLRRLPFVLATRQPLRMGRAEAMWLGWFGPIGIAALFYLSHSHEQGVIDSRVWAAGTLVVAVSTVLHGVTAPVGRRAYTASDPDDDTTTSTSIPTGRGSPTRPGDTRGR